LIKESDYKLVDSGDYYELIPLKGSPCNPKFDSLQEACNWILFCEPGAVVDWRISFPREFLEVKESSLETILNYIHDKTASYRQDRLRIESWKNSLS